MEKQVGTDKVKRDLAQMLKGGVIMDVVSAEHARIALGGAIDEADRQALGTSILNPADLGPGERDSVCMQCHLQPSVAFTGVRRFSRADYSFRHCNNSRSPDKFW